MKSETKKIATISFKEIITKQKETKLKKPDWIRTKLPSNLLRVQKIKEKIQRNRLLTICEEASCPNLFECFNRGTATFMILGPICTRRCPFCNVHHGRPIAPNINEIKKLSKTIFDMALQHVVITSVDRDDLHDGGAQYFADCISSIRKKNPGIKIEILVPDFRRCVDRALKIFQSTPPDIFNHNLETIPRLYRQVRPGANFGHSLRLLKHFKEMHPKIPTKSGLMVGLGETNDEILAVIHDLYQHGVRMLTLGQYLQPTSNHLPVQRYVSPDEFDEIKSKILEIGFTYVACGPLVRSSYHADLQAKGKEVK